MASTFKFHSQVNETVPWQAQYTFPTQSTRINKQVVKLPPKNGSQFTANKIMRIEFPADGYLNVLNSVLAFDVTMSGGTAFLQRGGAHNLIKRLRILYGSLVLEDIQEYKTLVRLLTESGVQQDYLAGPGTVLDGMYHSGTIDRAADDTVAITGAPDVLPATYGAATVKTALEVNYLMSGTTTATNLSASRRTYCLNLLSGILTSKKLLPLKWMASQVAIEVTFADDADALLSAADEPTYQIDDVNFIAEIVEFDSTYDTAFFAGLSQGGVPLKFSSWHYHSFNLSGTPSVLQIHERSRSVKAAFAVVRSTDSPSYLVDTDRFFYDVGKTYNGSGVLNQGTSSLISEFQWRVGGRYYPSQPVKCLYGASEALVELMKCLNSLGDYTRSNTITYQNWVKDKFIMSCEFENVDVMPDTIAGINAEEQSDIALTIKTLSGQPSGKKVDVFMHYDCLLVVRGNNVVDLVL